MGLKRSDISKEIIDEVSKKCTHVNNWTNIIYIAFDYAILIGAIFLAKTFFTFPIYLISAAIIASRFRAFENLNHEASHNRLFKSKTINHWASLIFCCIPVGSSFHSYKVSHFIHHRDFGARGLDPDRIRYRKLGIDNLDGKTPTYVMKQIFRLMVLCHTPVYLADIFKNFMFHKNTPRSENIVRIMVYVTCLLVCGYYNLWVDLFLFWFIPFVTFFQMIRIFAELSEHGGLYDQEKDDGDTRNNLYNPVVRFFIYPHKDCYHLVHHLFPNVPHAYLKAAHAILMNDRKYRLGHHCYKFLSFSMEKHGALRDIICVKH